MSSGRLQDVVNTCFPRRMFAEPGVFHIILEQLLSRIILGSCFWRVNRGQNGLQWPLRFQLFTFSRAVFISHEKSFSTNLRKRSLLTSWKVSKYRVFSGRYFPVFGLQECGKKRPRKNIRIWTLFTQWLICIMLSSWLL